MKSKAREKSPTNCERSLSMCIILLVLMWNAPVCSSYDASTFVLYKNEFAVMLRQSVKISDLEYYDLD